MLAKEPPWALPNALQRNQGARLQSIAEAGLRLNDLVFNLLILIYHILSPSILSLCAIFFLISVFFFDLYLTSVAAARQAEKAKNKLVEVVRTNPSSAATSRTASPIPTASTVKTGQQSTIARGKKTPASNPISQQKPALDQQALDISSLNLHLSDAQEVVDELPPKMSLAREKVLEEVRRSIGDTTKKKAVSLVVIGQYSVEFVEL